MRTARCASLHGGACRSAHASGVHITSLVRMLKSAPRSAPRNARGAARSTYGFTHFFTALLFRIASHNFTSSWPSCAVAKSAGVFFPLAMYSYTQR